MNKKIWIWNHYATNTFFDQGGRHYWMAKHLRMQGYNPCIFCASTIHGRDQTIEISEGKYYEDRVDKIPYVFIKTPDYQGNGKSRIQNMVTFYHNILSVSQQYAKKNGKPDMILASSVHPLTCVAGIKTARKLNVPCICEIRDLWPESIVAYSNYSRHNPVIKALYQLEHWIYQNADAVVFTFENAYQYIEEKHWEKDIPKEKVFYLNTGVDVNAFNYNASNYVIDDEELNRENMFRIVYTGSIRKVNNLFFLLQVAKQLQETNPEIEFFIYGDGDERESLERIVQEDSLNIVHFKGAVSKQYIPYVLSRADALLVIGQSSELSSKYGESWNKLFEYAASGKPVISNVKSWLIDEYLIGISFDNASPKEFADAILEIKSMSSDEKENICKNAKRMAEDYDARNLADGIVRIGAKICSSI